MGPGRRLGLLTGFLVMAVGAPTLPTMAQVVTISADEIALSVALGEFSNRTGVSIVYADRLIAGITASCRFTAGKLDAALDCLLSGTGLEARWPRDDQVVLSRITPAPHQLYLTGRVFDAESREPLPGAHVVLTDRSSGVVTDDNGGYRIGGISAGRVRLRFSHIGYELQEITFLAGENGESVLLKPQTIEGMAVVVEESRKTQDDDLSRMTESVVGSVDGIGPILGNAEFGVGTAATPGISRTGEISGQFVVRGGLPDQNVFKLDGATVYQPWHSQGLFSILQPTMVEGIRLFAGPLPADQGGYLASVLDAELSAGGSATSTTAAVSSTVGEVAFSTPLAPGVTAMFAGRRSHPGLNRTHSQSLPNNQQLGGGSFYDVAAKVGIRSTPNNRFYFTVYRGSDNLSWNPDPNTDGGARIDRWTNGVYAFKHRYVAGEGRLLVTNSVYVSTFDGFTTGDTVLEPAFEINDSQHVRDAAMKIDIDYSLAPRHGLKMGVEFTQHHLRWTDRKGADQYRDEVMEGAVFAHDTWQVTRKLVVRPGIRVSWFGNGVGWRPEPRFHAMYSVTDATSLHASWSYQVQYLHQISDIVSGGLGSTPQRWIVASSDAVKPSTGRQANFGVAARVGPRWSVSADVYWRDFENVFLPRDRFATAYPLKVTTINKTGGLSDFEQGTTKAYGVEMSADYRNRWFRFSSSYTGSRSLFRVRSQLASGNYRAGVYDTPHVVRSSTGYVGSRFSLIVSAEARTGYPTLAAVRGSAQQIGGDRMPTYFRLDAALGYKFKRFGLDWDVQGRMYNLTDRKNVVGYEYDRDLLYLRRTSLLGVSRWPTFHIQVSV